MDDLGDYLYIILLAVASIVGFLRKKKPAGKPQIKNPQKTWEEKMRDLKQSFPKQEAATTSPIVEEIQEEIVNEPTFSWKEDEDDKLEKIKLEIPQPEITQPIKKAEENKKQLEIINIDIDESEEVGGKWEIQTPEDARRAFVYAEILNRRY